MIVGVGASAGELEAYTELLAAMPETPNLALLLVSHLDSAQRSHLVQILACVWELPVQEVPQG